jgi:hypothetical protein
MKEISVYHIERKRVNSGDMMMTWPFQGQKKPANNSVAG